jgi:hypothetical protein
VAGTGLGGLLDSAMSAAQRRMSARPQNNAARIERIIATQIGTARSACYWTIVNTSR